MIKTYGERGDSYMGHRIKHEATSENMGIISSKNIPCEAEFVLDNTELKFDGTENNYRPWMEFSGHIKNLMGDFPCDIREIEFTEKKQYDARFRYDFSDEELAELAKKGLFSTEYVERGLNEPEIFFSGNVLEFPVIADVNVLKDKNGPNHAIFVDIQNRHYIKIDANSSGYTDGFSRHFADLEEIKAMENEHEEDMFLQNERFMEQIGNVELLDKTSDPHHIFEEDVEESDFSFDTDISNEIEMSLFEKYNIEQEVNAMTAKYQEDLKKQEEKYQAEKEKAAEQEQPVEEDAVQNDNTDLLNIDLSGGSDSKQKYKQAQIARRQQEAAQKEEYDQEEMTIEDFEIESDLVQDISDFEFM